MDKLALLLQMVAWPTAQTAIMVLVPTFFATLIGVPVGVILALWHPQGPYPHPGPYRLLDWLVNLLRSFPFLVLMILFFPLSRMIVGTTVGTVATLVPLSLAAAPLMARLAESAFVSVERGMLEAALSCGASTGQLVRYVWLQECRAALIRAMTLTAVNLVGYSAMAGAVGGGGLGDLAIRWGVHRYRLDVLITAVIVIILMVQVIQIVGEGLARWVSHE